MKKIVSHSFSYPIRKTVAELRNSTTLLLAVALILAVNSSHANANQFTLKVEKVVERHFSVPLPTRVSSINTSLSKGASQLACPKNQKGKNISFELTEPTTPLYPTFLSSFGYQHNMSAKNLSLIREISSNKFYTMFDPGTNYQALLSKYIFNYAHANKLNLNDEKIEHISSFLEAQCGYIGSLSPIFFNLWENTLERSTGYEDLLVKKFQIISDSFVGGVFSPNSPSLIGPKGEIIFSNTTGNSSHYLSQLQKFISYWEEVKTRQIYSWQDEFFLNAIRSEGPRVNKDASLSDYLNANATHIDRQVNDAKNMVEIIQRIRDGEEPMVRSIGNLPSLIIEIQKASQVFRWQEIEPNSVMPPGLEEFHEQKVTFWEGMLGQFRSLRELSDNGIAETLRRMKSEFGQEKLTYRALEKIEDAADEALKIALETRDLEIDVRDKFGIEQEVKESSLAAAYCAKHVLLSGEYGWKNIFPISEWLEKMGHRFVKGNIVVAPAYTPFVQGPCGLMVSTRFSQVLFDEDFGERNFLPADRHLLSLITQVHLREFTIRHQSNEAASLKGVNAVAYQFERFRSMLHSINRSIGLALDQVTRDMSGRTIAYNQAYHPFDEFPVVGGLEADGVTFSLRTLDESTIELRSDSRSLRLRPNYTRTIVLSGDQKELSDALLLWIEKRNTSEPPTISFARDTRKSCPLEVQEIETIGFSNHILVTVSVSPLCKPRELNALPYQNVIDALWEVCGNKKCDGYTHEDHHEIEIRYLESLVGNTVTFSLGAP